MRLFAHLFGFGDTALSLLGHPYALARTSLRKEISASARDCKPGRMLDVGCGSMPYKNLFPQATSYEGLEIDQPRNRLNPNVSHFYDGKIFPLPDNTFAIALCSQVLEHSFEPELLLRELHRILSPGGTLILTIPFFWPEHEQPYDSQRFTSFGLAQRLEDIGFGSIKARKTNPGLAAILQLTNEWIESLYRGRLAGKRLTAVKLALSIPYTLANLIGCTYRGILMSRNRSQSAEMYLDLVVTAQKA